MAQVAVMARIPAVPGRRDELAKALQAAVDNANGEDGTIYYILHEDVKDADSLWMYEVYSSQEAFDAHMGSEFFKTFAPTLGGLMGGRLELTVLKPVSGKGL